jgi:site-specific recombinase XerC
MTSQQVYERINENKTELGLMYHICLIQLRGGFRVSEVLKMTSTNVIDGSNLYIVSDKGSISKRVYVPEISKELTKWKKNTIAPFKHISRFQVYRMYKRLGIGIVNGKNKNDSVTHALRKNYIRESHASTNDIELTKELIGHKNVKSTSHYLRSKRSKN